MAATAEDLASQIVGVWKHVSSTNKEVATGKVTHPFGEKLIGYLVFTKAGRIIWTRLSGTTAQSRRVQWPQMQSAYACTTR
jgi:hypothetical protein